MEINFQQQPEAAIPIPIPMSKTTKFKGRSRSKSNNNKYVGVRQRPSGRWVAEIKDTTQKIRMWLGTFETAEEAARAYDEAACLLRGSNTRTNFVTHVSLDSPLASRIRNLLNNRKTAKQIGKDSRATTSSNISNPSPSPSNSSCVTSSRRSSSSPSSSVDSLSPSCQKTQDSSLFDDAYKPDLSNCSDEFDMGSCTSGISWGLEQEFDDRFSFTQDQLLDLPNKYNADVLETGEMEFSEFERMKVERQISASLYAMNGVQEYMETVCDPIEALWDLPPLCSLLC